MSTRDRTGGLVLISMVGLGLVAAAYAIWVQGALITQNQRLIRQQQATVDRLLTESAEDRAQTAQLRSLVAALQAQVRQLGGTPLTTAPTPSTSPAARSRTPSGAPTTAPSRGTRTPPASPRPSPTSQPPSSPTPTPSPTPTRICIGPICLPGG